MVLTTHQHGRKVLWAVAGLAVAWTGFMLSGKGVLVSQDIADGGEEYWVEGWGNLGTSDDPSLVCTYFVGTRTRQQVFWYSPDGFLGRRDCPVMVDR